MRRALKWFLFATLGAYALVLSVLFIVQRQFYYYPDQTQYTPETAGLSEFEAIAPDTEACGLYSWFRQPDNPNAPVIVYAHGNAGSLAFYAFELNMMADWGFGVMAVGYPGYGGAPGAPSEDALAGAASASYDWLRRQGYDAENIVIYGHSLGAGVATRLAAEKKAAGLILSAPFTSMTDMAARQAPWLPGASFLVRDRFANDARIATIKMPLIWIHGLRDQLIPYEMGARLYGAAGAPKCAFALENAAHNNVWARGGGAVVKAQAEALVAGNPCTS